MKYLEKSYFKNLESKREVIMPRTKRQRDMNPPIYESTYLIV